MKRLSKQMETGMAQFPNGMSVMEAINGRSSVRDYAPEKIDQATVIRLLAAAMRAPTAAHGEPWAFVIVQDADILRRISVRAKEFFVREAHNARLHAGNPVLANFADPDFNVFYNAGTLIVICADSTGPFVFADCWLAAGNLMLAASAMGLGTCVIGSSVSALNSSELKAELGIPATVTAIAPIIVGVPAGETPQTDRKEPQILVWK
jgi:nitroreductase